MLFETNKDKVRAGNIGVITLRTEPNSNNQGFNTYQYMVKI